MKQLHLLLLLAIFFSCKPDPKITGWRGESRSGIFAGENLLTVWPEDGPDLIWETEAVGNGYSSPVMSGNFVYVTGELDSLGYLFKFDQQGKEIWRSAYGREWTENFPGPRGAPALSGDKIYLCSGLGTVCCMDAGTGKRLWEKNLVSELGGISPRFGYAEGLLVDGDKIYCMPGGKTANVVALDRHNGDLLWENAGFGERPSYCSPQLIEHKGKKILVAFSAYHLMGLDAGTGKLLWSHEQTNTTPEEREPGNGDTHGNTVLYDNGFIYYAAGDGNCGVKLQLNDEGTAIEQVWQNKTFDSYMSGMVKIGNHVYTAGHRKKQLLAVDCETGLQTDSLATGRGITICAGGLIYFYSEQGQVSLVDPTLHRMKTLSSFKLQKGTKEHFAHPAIHNGVLYIRHGNYLGAWQIHKQS